MSQPDENEPAHVRQLVALEATVPHQVRVRGQSYDRDPAALFRLLQIAAVGLIGRHL